MHVTIQPKSSNNSLQMINGSRDAIDRLFGANIESQFLGRILSITYHIDQI